jgi:hypothetical protein
MSTLREKRQRFSVDDDLCLLREVTAQNPIKEAKAWSTVQENIEKTVGKKFSIRTLKDHLQLLLEVYLKKDMVSQKKSGVEEIFSERDNLLQEISDLCKEFKKSRRPKVNKLEQIVNLRKQVRDEQALLFSTELQEENSVNKTEEFSFVAEVPIVQMHEEAVEMEITQDIQENINNGNEQNGNLLDQVEETPSVSARKILMPKRKRYNKSRPLRQNAIQYLSEKNDRELQLKLKELKLQERKVRLEERRLEFEIEEQRKRADSENSRMQLALDQQQNIHDLIKNQQKIIEALISRL